MAVSGVTEFTNIVPELWAPSFYENLKKNLPITNFFTREYEGVISQLGDTVNINEFANPTAETLTDDKDQFATQAVSITQHQLVADRRFSTAYEITDLAKLQSQEFEAELRQNMMYALAKSVEEYIVTLMVASASAPDHQITTTAANSLALADLISCAELLSAQGVEKANRAFFADPAFYYDVVGDSSISSRDYTPGGPVVSGNVPFPVVGFDFMEAQNLTQYTGHAAHRSALAIVMQQGVRLKISDQHSNRKYGYIMSADVVMGAKLLSDVRLVNVAGS